MASTIRQRTEQRRFGPKEASHPSVGQPCPKCKKPLAAGDYTTLLPVKSTDISPNVTIVEADEAHWVLEILQRHARGAKLTSEQAAIAKNIEEGVRRATVAFLAIVAERSRSYS